MVLIPEQRGLGIDTMGARPKVAMPVMPEPPKAPDALPPPPQESPTAKAAMTAGNRMSAGLATQGTMLTSRRGANSFMPTPSGMKSLLGA